MNAHVRTRGVLTVQSNRRSDPNSVLAELQQEFGAFTQRYDSRHDKLEESIDELNASVAAMRVGPSSDRSSAPAARRKARDAFAQFALTGKPDAMQALLPQNARYGSTDSDPDGGFLVPEEIDTEITERLINVSPMRRLATVRQTRGNVYKKLISIGGGTAEWVGERQSRPQTDMNQYKEIAITPMEIYANPALTQTLLDDASVDAAAEVSTEIAKDFDIKEGDAWINGDGVNRPRGFLKYATPVTTSDATRAFGTLQYFPSGVAAALFDGTHNGADALLDVVYGLNAQYRANATWLMNSATIGAVRKLKDLEGRYVWQPPVAAGQPATLLGYPVETDENMPDIGAGNFPIAFGDWKQGYMIVDRIGIRVLRDPFTNKPYVHFYTTKRVGGGMLHSNAIKLLKIAAT
jgi:HK97 family phage major capsid protein